MLENDFLTAVLADRISEAQLDAFFEMAIEHLEKNPRFEISAQTIELVRALHGDPERPLEARPGSQIGRIEGRGIPGIKLFRRFVCVVLIIICPDWRKEVADGFFPRYVYRPGAQPARSVRCDEQAIFQFQDVDVFVVEALRRSRGSQAGNTLPRVPLSNEIVDSEMYTTLLSNMYTVWAKILAHPEDYPVATLDNPYNNEKPLC